MSNLINSTNFADNLLHKVDTFAYLPTSLMQEVAYLPMIGTRCLAIQMEPISTFLILFGADVNILFMIKVETLMLVESSHSPPPPHYADF